jgi:serine protease Do
MNELANWSKTRKPLALALVALTLGVGIVMGTLISGHVGASRAYFEGGAKTLSIPDPVIMSNAFSGIVNKLEPAVVHISTTQMIQSRPRPRVDVIPGPGVRPRRPNGNNPNNPGGNNPNDPNNPSGKQDQNQDPYQDFFNRFFDNPDDGPQDHAEQSLGSGIIVDPKGFILTNNHVVDQATKISVTLNGSDQKYYAKVVGVDPDTDLAVIKIDYPKDLPIAKLGNSDGVQVGDWVLAIGSPFGLDATVTAGIISAKDRSANLLSEDGNHQYQRFLQTDAAINPGNSGGPLVDMAGQVVGINTAILTGSRSTGNEGVGFALPSNIAINIYNQLVQSGHVVRGGIGVQFQDGVSMNSVVLHHLGADYGVVVQLVVPGGPADKAGLKVGDVLTKVNGKPVHASYELIDPIMQTPIGNKVRVSFIRDKQEHELTITVEDMSKLFPETARKGGSDDEGNAPAEPAAAAYGLHVQELSPALEKQFDVSAKSGVIVTRDPEPASFGEDLQLRGGSVIIEINDQPIANLADYKRVMATLKPGQEVIFKVLSRSSAGQTTSLHGGVVPASDK